MLLLAAISKSIFFKLNGLSRLPTRFLLALACSLTTVCVLQAQEPQTSNDVVKVDTKLLVYPIRVRDKRGSAPTVLTDRDLTLKDEDHVTAGLYLYAGVDSLSLVFALDQSGSLRNIIAQQRAKLFGALLAVG